MEGRLNVARVQFSGKETHGYGVITNKLFAGLAHAGANILDPREDGWDIRLAFGTPVNWMLPRNGQIQDDFVLHTMFDTDLIPPSWVDILNSIGLVWVPSTWCKEVFERSGVDRPIIVSGYGVDTELFDYVERGWLSGEEPSYRNEEYTFLTMAGTYADRKNEALVRQAFADLNLPNAKLIVKIRDGGGIITERTRVTGRNIEFRVGEMPVDDWARLMGRCDCFISMSSGEGFSLVPLEAMATGLPGIVHAYGGPVDYIESVGAIPVDPKQLIWADNYNAIFRVESRCAFPDMEMLKQKMLWCYENPDQAAALGKRSSEIVRKNFTWEIASQRALSLLSGWVSGGGTRNDCYCSDS